MSVEDLLLPMCAKVLNLCDVVNDRYQLYILHLGEEIYVYVMTFTDKSSQGAMHSTSVLSLTGGPLRGCKAFSLTMRATFAISQQSRLHRL